MTVCINNDYVEFTATEEQLLQIMANAVNAASPVGLGFLQYQPGTILLKI